MICVVTRRGSPCAHCRSINGIFNCFWLRSVGWVWVKPISRLEETVKNCLWKTGLTLWQTGCVVVCYYACRFLIYVRIMWDYGSMCVSVWTRESECPWSSGKKMSYGISDYMLQWRTVFSFFFPPVKLKALATAKVSEDWNQTQNSGQTWTQNREKSHAEKPILWFYVTYVVLNFTHCFAQSKVFQDEEKSCQ